MLFVEGKNTCPFQNWIQLELSKVRRKNENLIKIVSQVEATERQRTFKSPFNTYAN